MEQVKNFVTSFIDDPYEIIAEVFHRSGQAEIGGLILGSRNFFSYLKKQELLQK